MRRFVAKKSLRATVATNKAAHDFYRMAGDERTEFGEAIGMPKKRVTPSKPSGEPTEKDIQTAIVAFLRYNPRVNWFMRLNSGAAMYEGNPVFFYSLYLKNCAARNKGAGDIIGQLAYNLGGRLFCLEVKRPGKKATEEQQDFLDAVNAGGGIGRVVCSVSDAEAALG